MGRDLCLSLACLLCAAKLIRASLQPPARPPELWQRGAVDGRGPHHRRHQLGLLLPAGPAHVAVGHGGWVVRQPPRCWRCVRPPGTPCLATLAGPAWLGNTARPLCLLVCPHPCRWATTLLPTLPKRPRTRQWRVRAGQPCARQHAQTGPVRAVFWPPVPAGPPLRAAQASAPWPHNPCAARAAPPPRRPRGPHHGHPGILHLRLDVPPVPHLLHAVARRWRGRRAAGKQPASLPGVLGRACLPCAANCCALALHASRPQSPVGALLFSAPSVRPPPPRCGHRLLPSTQPAALPACAADLHVGLLLPLGLL